MLLRQCVRCWATLLPCYSARRWHVYRWDQCIYVLLAIVASQFLVLIVNCTLQSITDGKHKAHNQKCKQIESKCSTFTFCQIWIFYVVYWTSKKGVKYTEIYLWHVVSINSIVLIQARCIHKKSRVINYCVTCATIAMAHFTLDAQR